MVVRIIGSGGDYTTLETWEASLTGTFSENQIGALKNENFTPSGTWQFAGFTTATNARLIIRAATAAEVGTSAKHNGLAGTGARIFKNNGGFWGAIHINDVNIKHWEVHDLELYSNGAANIGIQSATAFDDAMISGCLTHDVGETGINLSTASGSGTVRVWNCIVWNASSLSSAGGITGASTAPDRVEVYNCTVIKTQTDADNAATGIRYCIVKNCASLHWGPTNGHADFLNTGTGSNYNASSDTSSPGANSLDNVVATNHFNSVGGTWDLHLKSTSTLIGAGTPLASVTTDIDGQTRDAVTPDIGADEFIITSTDYTRILPIIDPRFNIAHGINIDVPPVGRKRN